MYSSTPVWLIVAADSGGTWNRLWKYDWDRNSKFYISKVGCLGWIHMLSKTEATSFGSNYPFQDAFLNNVKFAGLWKVQKQLISSGKNVCNELQSGGMILTNCTVIIGILLVSSRELFNVLAKSKGNPCHRSKPLQSSQFTASLCWKSSSKKQWI